MTTSYQFFIVHTWIVNPKRNETPFMFSQLFERFHLHKNPILFTSSLFLGVGLCVCVCLCVFLCVCYQHNSRTNFNRILKFGILHLYDMQMLLKTFYKDGTRTLCTGAHKSITYIAYGRNFQFVNFGIFRLHKI